MSPYTCLEPFAAEARDQARGEHNGARRKDTAAVDCPPQYCACPGDGIDHPAPSDEVMERLRELPAVIEARLLDLGS